MRNLAAILILVVVLFYGGCSVGRLGSIMSTPTWHEKKIPAEYDLAAEYDIAEEEGKKLLVIVEQPISLNAPVNLRYYITKAMNEKLADTIEISADNLVSYSQLAKFRAEKYNFSMMSASEKGKALQADFVVVVTVNDYYMRKIADMDYYKGYLHASATLFDSGKGEKLWPESEDGKNIVVGFDVESKGRNSAAIRLANAVAHCTVRHLYDCPEKKYKIFEDRIKFHWDTWDQTKQLEAEVER